MSSTRPEDVPQTRVRRGAAAEGRLRIEGGLDGATIRTASGLGDLLHGSWTSEPEVVVEGGEVTLRYASSRGARLRQIARRKRRRPPRSQEIGPDGDEIVLNAAVPWDISIDGRVQHVEADLRGIRLRSLTVKGRVSRSVLLLGRPDQDVHLGVTSADRLTVRRPADTQVRVRITRGASQVVVDDQTYRAIGGETVLTTGPTVWNDYHLDMTAAFRLRVTTL